MARQPGHPASTPLRIDDIETIALHETTDPELVVIEIAGKGAVTTTGQSFESPSIQVFCARDGLIPLMRDRVGVADGVADLPAH